MALVNSSLNRSERIKQWFHHPIRTCLMIVLVCQAVLLTWAGKSYSPTWDEPGHLVAGLSHWKFGRFDLYSVNPPLVRTIAAAPVHFFMNPEMDWTGYSKNPSHRSEVALGQTFIDLNGTRSLTMLFVARLMVIPIAMLGTLLCFLFARDLFGQPRAGIAAAVLWALSPFALGYGGLITTDIGSAVFGLAAAYAFWLHLRQPTWDRAILVAVTVGLACLTKSVWLVLPFLAACGYLAAWLMRDRWQIFQRVTTPETNAVKGASLSRTTYIAQACVASLAGLTMVNAFYGFQGTFKTLGSYDFVSLAGSGRSFADPTEESKSNQKIQTGSTAINPVSMTSSNQDSKAEPCPYCQSSEKASSPASCPECEARKRTDAGVASCPECEAKKGAKQEPAIVFEPGNRYRGTLLGAIPVPLPDRYVLGMDVQRRDFESGLYRPEWASYFGGNWQRGGWWYFYIAGLFLKTPVVFWLLLALGTVAAIVMRQPATTKVGALCLWVPALVLLVIVSWNTGLNRYVRYAIPVLPALCIWASASVCIPMGAWFGARPRLQQAASLVAIGLIVASVITPLAKGPNWLSYFSVAAGGSERGHEWLIDSNLDWGQDLGKVQKWLAKHPQAKDVTLAYFGSFNPKSVGVDFRSPIPNSQDLALQVLRSEEESGPKPGWYILSKNFVMGHSMPIPAPDGSKRFNKSNPLTLFQEFEPVDRIGDTMLVYQLEQKQVDRFRVALGLPIIRTPSNTGRLVVSHSSNP
jgi:4-amino-4-deoxy-L-arabinose transferase-like glycosyltransferase